MSVRAPELICEISGGEPYEYYPLGEYVVSALGVCQGEPTFKYTRIGVRHAIELISGGRTVQEVATAYELPVAAVQEALVLALRAFQQRVMRLRTLGSPRIDESALAAMAVDPAIQRELRQIESEFSVTEADGLDRS